MNELPELTKEQFLATINQSINMLLGIEEEQQRQEVYTGIMNYAREFELADEVEQEIQKKAAERGLPELHEVLEKSNKYKDFKLVTAEELQKANLPPTKFLVDEILPEGTSIIAAPSKIGKSWFVLDMGLSIAAGKTFLSHKANTNGVLYLALEDSWSRLQSRMNKVLGGVPAPRSFYYMVKAPTLDTGLINMLTDTIKAHPEIKLIIVDTLQKIRGAAQRGEAAYAQDYREMGMLKEFADKNGISTFFVHHTRKMKDDDDAFNMISGTNGIMGAADTSFALIKDKREDENAVLHITGRDVAQTSDLVRFNKDVWKWERVGDYSQIKQQREKFDHDNNPIVKTIVALLDESQNGWWSGRMSELLEEGERIIGEEIADSPKKLGCDVKKLIEPLKKYNNIITDIAKNGNSGKMYHFHRVANFQDFNLDDFVELLP